MRDLSGAGFVVVVMIVFGFSLLGWAAYVESTYTPEQICAKQTIVRSAYCDALIDKIRNNK